MKNIKENAKTILYDILLPKLGNNNYYFDDNKETHSLMLSKIESLLEKMKDWTYLDFVKVAKDTSYDKDKMKWLNPDNIDPNISLCCAKDDYCYSPTNKFNDISYEIECVPLIKTKKVNFFGSYKHVSLLWEIAHCLMELPCDNSLKNIAKELDYIFLETKDYKDYSIDKLLNELSYIEFVNRHETTRHDSEVKAQVVNLLKELKDSKNEEMVQIPKALYTELMKLKNEFDKFNKNKAESRG